MGMTGRRRGLYLDQGGVYSHHPLRRPQAQLYIQLRVAAGGRTRSIEAYGGFNFAFRSGNDLVQVLQTNVGHVAELRCP